MQCPQCKLQLRIGKSYAGIADGKPQIVQEMYCVNPKCRYGKSKVPIGVVRHFIPSSDKDDAVKSCCDRTLARIGKESYFIAPDVEAECKGGILKLSCPKCGKNYEYDISGLKEE